MQGRNNLAPKSAEDLVGAYSWRNIIANKSLFIRLIEFSDNMVSYITGHLVTNASVH